MAQTQEQEEILWTSGRPDGHAPMGVMGDHTHNKGEWMFSYRYMYMDMEEMRSGTNTLTNDEVIFDNNFTVTPERMPMHMHMLGLMYAVSDRLTLMGMVSFHDREMDHVTRMGGIFTTESGGFGDIKISGLYKFFDKKHQRVHANLGFSIPTGSIDERDETPLPMPAVRQLPYPMQIGSGTFDIMPGVTYLNQLGDYSMGAQIMATIRTGENDRDYRLGDQLKLTYWSAYRLNKLFSFSGRLSFLTIGQIDGADPELGLVNMMNTELSTVPTVFPENFGGEIIHAGVGFNFYVPEGILKNVRIGAEYEFPLMRDLNGIQMETDQMVTVGIQYSL